MPIDFDESSENFSVFSGVTFAKVSNPDDNTDQVGQFINSGSNDYEGAYLDLQRPIDLSQHNEIRLNFYSYDNDAHNILIKIEQGSTFVEVEKSIPAGNENQWVNDILFDFSSYSGTYSRITIFIDGGEKKSGTFLIDDIDDGSTPTDPNALDVEYTNLVWSDEFDGNSLDTNKWHHQTFGPNGGRWFNGELQHYTDSETNSFVANGNLNIVAKKETITQNGITLNYTSARLNSKFAFTYGRVDVRAKLPEGNGTWPAIWTLGKNISEPGSYWETQGFGTTPWPACGEIDIMEHGLHATNVVSSAIHTPSSFGATVNTATKSMTDVANNFHKYSMNWSPNQITFLVDGKVYYTYKPSTKNSSTWPFNLDQFLLLNVAIGGYSGTPASNFTEVNMAVDYVRVYQSATASTDNFFSSNFTVYPNPVSNNIQIKTSEPIHKIEMYSSLGKKVLTQNNNLKSINVNSLSSGLYLLKITSNNKVATKKVIVKK
ncbi:MAG: family 16 glycosylhydrolase [Flavobacteriaceae bacterium]|nr:family 16 glycosylhydrolase [Flavobacteriaceae bacterium]